MRTLYSSVQNFKLSVILPVYANAFTYRYKECHYFGLYLHVLTIIPTVSLRHVTAYTLLKQTL